MRLAVWSLQHVLLQHAAIKKKYVHANDGAFYGKRTAKRNDAPHKVFEQI